MNMKQNMKMNNQRQIFHQQVAFKIKQKQYEDEQQIMAIKHNDNHQVKDLKNRMKCITQKLTTMRKQKQSLEKNNKTLQQEVMNLQNNLRQMISGFCNTSSNFPMPNQLSAKIAEFYKYECLQIFFDLLCCELNMKGIIYFYHQCFTNIHKIIKQYFEPASESIMRVGCFECLDGPIDNVLRKAYQSSFTKILNTLYQSGKIQSIAQKIQSDISLTGQSNQKDPLQQVYNFLKKLTELMLCCHISDPGLQFQMENFGKKIKFNSLKNDPLDGFIQQKQQCWVVIPEIKKTDSKESFIKSLVLQTNYDLPN